MPTRKVTVVAGQPVTLTEPMAGLFELPNRDPVTGTTATVKYDSPGTRIVKFTATETIELDVQAAPVVVPPVQPSGHDVEILPGQSISTVVSDNGGGKSYGVRPGQYSGTIRIARDNVKLIALGDVTVQGSSGQTYGIDFLWDNKPGPQNITVEGLRIRGFGGGVRVQHMDIQNAPRAQHARNIFLRKLRLVGMTGTGSHEGHGVFAANVDGLTIEECLIDGAGLAGSIRDIYVHGVYSKEGNRDVVLRKNFVVNAESFGLQARGTTWREDDSVTVPGPQIIDNLIYDACNGIAVDGHNARVTGNLIGVRYFHLGTRRNGWAGVYGSVGTLTQGGNVRFRAAGNTNRTDGWQDRAWRNAPRSDDVWCRRGACRTVATDKPDADKVLTTVDLSTLVSRARNGEPVAALIAEAKARV